MTKIKQDTEAVHLTGQRGEALCSADLRVGVPTVPVGDWAQGFTPASLGARVCGDCEQKAGTAATYAEGERDAEARASGLPRMRPGGPGVPKDVA